LSPCSASRSLGSAPAVGESGWTAYWYGGVLRTATSVLGSSFVRPPPARATHTPLLAEIASGIPVPGRRGTVPLSAPLPASTVIDKSRFPTHRRPYSLASAVGRAPT